MHMQYSTRIICPMIAVPNCPSTCVYADSADALYIDIDIYIQLQIDRYTYLDLDLDLSH